MKTKDIKKQRNKVRLRIKKAKTVIGRRGRNGRVRGEERHCYKGKDEYEKE